LDCQALSLHSPLAYLSNQSPLTPASRASWIKVHFILPFGRRPLTRDLDFEYKEESVVVSGHLITRFVVMTRCSLFYVDCVWIQSWTRNCFSIRTHPGRTVVWFREAQGRKWPDGISRRGSLVKKEFRRSSLLYEEKNLELTPTFESFRMCNGVLIASPRMTIDLLIGDSAVPRGRLTVLRERESRPCSSADESVRSQ
jgi:hypothetical protein